MSRHSVWNICEDRRAGISWPVTIISCVGKSGRPDEPPCIYYLGGQEDFVDIPGG